MIQRTLQQVTKMIKTENNIEKWQDNRIKGVCIDTRKLMPGNLFVPFKGESFDGHQFVEKAIEQGAVAALWQKDVPNPPLHLPILVVENTLIALQELARSYRDQLNVKVVGITGSNGKTTTKDMTANLLSLQYKVQKTEGNYNNHIGLPLTILSLEEDTEIAVLEMGMSSRGEIEFLSKLARPNVAIITNIGEAHLLDLGSREAIAEAKLEIITGLQENGVIIYHGDEMLLQEKMADFKGSAQIQTFGKNPDHTLYPTQIRSMDSGSIFKVNGTDEEFILPILGTHNIFNALAAMLAARYFQIPFKKMNDGFNNLKLTSMRMELVQGRKGEKIINDAYNASPTSMRAAVELVSSLEGYERKIVVLGDMLELGPNEMEFHYEIGQTLNPDQILYVFTYGQLGEYIANGAKTVFAKDRVFSFQDKQALAIKLSEYVNEQTIVLVKASRGMKLEEVVSALC